jgi:hypothetical protein
VFVAAGGWWLLGWEFAVIVVFQSVFYLEMHQDEIFLFF